MVLIPPPFACHAAFGGAAFGRIHDGTAITSFPDGRRLRRLDTKATKLTKSTKTGLNINGSPR